MGTTVVPYTIPSGVTVPGDFNILDLGARSIVAVKWPDVMTNVNVQFRAAYFAGEFPLLAPDGVAFTEVAVPGDVWTLSNNEVRFFRALQRMIIMTGGAEASDRVFQIISRAVG